MWLENRRRAKADKLLAKGQVERAILIYQELNAWDVLVDVYQRQGNPKAAAEAAKKAGLIERAARLYEEAGAYREAADIWLRTPNKGRAGEALERANDFEAAAELYVSLGMYAQAAAALAKLQRFTAAAQLYERVGNPAEAAKMYFAARQPAEAARVLELAGEFERAARIQYELGNKLAAAKLFAKANLPVESAKCFSEMGNYRQAGEALLAAGMLVEAAELLEREDSTLALSAQLFRKILTHNVAWQQEMDDLLVCLEIAETGNFIAVGCATKGLVLLDASGNLLWRFTEVWGGRPNSVAVTADGRTFMAWDDKKLSCLGADKTPLWSRELPSEATHVATNPAGEIFLCSTKDGLLLCYDRNGTLVWEKRGSEIIWDVALSADGKVVAYGTGEGSCVLLNAAGERITEYRAQEWVHSISPSADGALLALGVGMERVELVDARIGKAIWSVEEGTPIHSVTLSRLGNVLSVGDGGAFIRDANGERIWSFKAQERLLGGSMDPVEKAVILRFASKRVMCLKMQHFKERAAANYERSGNLRTAAEVYEEIGDHPKAAALFQQIGSYAEAARNLAAAGQIVEAAMAYERANNFAQAADAYLACGHLQKAAECFVKAGEPLPAAKLFEEMGNIAEAAELYNRAGEYAKAGMLYRTLGAVPFAVDALRQHVIWHPNDAEKQLELGLLLQENAQYDAAIEHLQKAANAEELRRTALIHVAQCFVAKNMYDVALNRYIACLKDGEQPSPENLEIFYEIAKTHALAGNYTEARRLFESILAVDYQYRDVHERLEEIRALSDVFTKKSTHTVASGRTVISDEGYQRLSSETKERYFIKGQLGKGGMGVVYLAEDKRLKRTVALKILPPEMAADDGLRLRMIREAQAVAQIAHPNVVAVYDVGEEEGRSYISMEYIDGASLRAILRERGVFAPRECVELLIQVTDGLGYAHRKGITHRDIKPENIMVTREGTAKVMDFGLALIRGTTRLTVQGGVAGTWDYMAPEQMRGDENLTPAVDVYAIGCMAYEMLTGTVPFPSDSVGVQRLSQLPKNLCELRPDLPHPLGQVIMKCLEPDASNRFPDASALNAALREVSRVV